MHKNFYSRENYFFEYLKKKSIFLSAVVSNFFGLYPFSRIGARGLQSGRNAIDNEGKLTHE